MSNSYILPLLVSASMLIMMLLFFITLFILINKNKHRKLIADKMALQYAFEKEMLTTRIEVQEESFTKMSQEIHDNICQVLGSVKNNMYVLAAGAGSSNDQSISESTDMLGKAIESLRNLSHVLNPEYIQKIGLEEAIEKELTYLKSGYGINYTVNFEGEPVDLPADHEIIIFRILQEILSNIIKHAEARNIDLTIVYTSGEIVIKVADDGKGFDIHDDQDAGIGLINIRQRVKLINGIFDIHSSVGEGTEAIIKIDIE